MCVLFVITLYCCIKKRKQVKLLTKAKNSDEDLNTDLDGIVLQSTPSVETLQARLRIAEHIQQNVDSVSSTHDSTDDLFQFK